MKRFRGLVLLAVPSTVLLHCGGGDDSAPAGPTSDAGGIDAATVDGASEASTGIAVHGTLRGRASDGGPLAGRDIVVIDANGVVTKTGTDASGAFTAAGVAVPYDVAVPYIPLDAAAPAYPYYYAGITRPDPVVLGIDYAFQNDLSSQATVKLAANVATGATLYFAGTSDSDTFSGTGSTTTFTDSTYRWIGATTLSTPFHVYVKSSTGDFTGFVDLPAQSLTNGGTKDLGTLAFTALGASTSFALSGTVPSGYTVEGAEVEVLDPDGSRVVDFNLGPSGSGTVKLPPVSTLTVTGRVLANGPNGEMSEASEEQSVSASSLAVSVPAAPTPLTPTDHSTSDDSQPFTWSAFETPTIYGLTLATASGTSIGVVTSGTSFDRRKLAAAGFGLASGTAYTWSVSAGGLTSVTTMDEYLAADPPATLNVAVRRAYSVGRSFTTP